MTQAFNPFAQAPATSTAPVAPAQAQAARTQAVATDMNDPSLFDGLFAPYFRHIDGEFDLQVTGYSGTTAAQTPKKGRSVHISFKVLNSSNPALIPVGSDWRISYAYNWEHMEKSDKDSFGKEMQKLANFVQSLFKSTRGAAGFDTKAAERSLHTHDWIAQPGYVHLSASLGKEKEVGGSLVRYRNDLWLPVAAAT
jgi:hypothetical protein